MTIKEEISKRRTFGIISHPDAGKTTLTENRFIFGGAIQKAGAVKSSKITDHSKSDFMEADYEIPVKSFVLDHLKLLGNRIIADLR